MEVFAEIVNGFKLLTIFAKISNLDVYWVLNTSLLENDILRLNDMLKYKDLTSFFKYLRYPNFPKKVIDLPLDNKDW